MRQFQFQRFRTNPTYYSGILISGPFLILDSVVVRGNVDNGVNWLDAAMGETDKFKLLDLDFELSLSFVPFYSPCMR